MPGQREENGIEDKGNYLSSLGFSVCIVGMIQILGLSVMFAIRCIISVGDNYTEQKEHGKL